MNSGFRYWLWRLLWLTLIGWLLVCVGMYALQRKLLYMPQPRHVATPLMAMPTDVGDVLVSLRESDSADALIYFGGNAEDVSFSLEPLARAFPGYAIYLLHYRGFGGSAGEPNEVALVADAEQLFDKVRTRHANVAVIGRSLGAGVATQLAARRPVRRLALVTPFDSVEAVAAGLYPLLPVSWLLKDKFASVEHVAAIRAPTLVLWAGRDQVVAKANTLRLIERFPPGQVMQQEIAEADHNDIAASPIYYAALQQFMHSAATPTAREGKHETPGEGA